MPCTHNIIIILCIFERVFVSLRMRLCCLTSNSLRPRRQRRENTKKNEPCDSDTGEETCGFFYSLLFHFYFIFYMYIVGKDLLAFKTRSETRRYRSL